MLPDELLLDELLDELLLEDDVLLEEELLLDDELLLDAVVSEFCPPHPLSSMARPSETPVSG